MARGKLGNPNYAQLTAQVPRSLKKQFQSELLWLDLDLSQAIEQLISAYLDGKIELQGNTTTPRPPTPRPRKTPVVDRAPTAEGATLRSQREALGLSQQQLSDRLVELGLQNVSKAALGRYERGQRAAPVEVVEAVRKLIEGEQ